MTKLSLRQFSALTGVPLRDVHKLIDNNHIPVIIIGRQRFISEDIYREYLAGGKPIIDDHTNIGNHVRGNKL